MVLFQHHPFLKDLFAVSWFGSEKLTACRRNWVADMGQRCNTALTLDHASELSLL